MNRFMNILMAGVCSAAMLTVATLAFADSVESHPIGPGKGAGPSQPGVWDGWGALLLSLAVVVGLILLARWLIRRSGSAVLPRSGGGAVEVLHRSAVSMKHQVLLVRLGRRVLLVGVTPQGMNTLAELTDPAEIGEVVAALDKTKGEGFASLLRNRSAQIRQATQDAQAGQEVRRLADKLREQGDQEERKT